MRACLLCATVVGLPLLLAVHGCHPGGRRASSAGPAEDVEVVEQFWPNGKLRLRKHVLRMPDGTLVDHGKYEQWYDNGTKEYEATYVHGALDGVETAWHKNGRKRTEQHYRHGLRHGSRYDWDQEGRKRKEENYFDDRPHGTWTVWSPDGHVKWQGRFDHGQPLP